MVEDVRVALGKTVAVGLDTDKVDCYVYSDDLTQSLAHVFKEKKAELATINKGKG